MDAINYIFQYARLATLTDVLDVVIVAYLLYKVFQFIRGTTAERLLKGIIVLVVVMQLSGWLQFNVINFVLVNTMQLGFLAIIIVFQPELRKMLERFGRGKFPLFADKQSIQTKMTNVISQTVEACSAMSAARVGALIVFEKEDRLRDIVKSGTVLDAEISVHLLENIFYPKAPLHDGAIIVRYDRIVAAGCVLPLSSNPNISRGLGTRHRAAVGASESSDCICVIVPEETGAISVAVDGILKRHLAPETLTKLLENALIPAQGEKAKKGGFLWRKGKE